MGRLIREPTFNIYKGHLFWTFLQPNLGGRIIFGSAYMRVYTVPIPVKRGHSKKKKSSLLFLEGSSELDPISAEAFLGEAALGLEYVQCFIA